jgi:hypothetical protein
MEIKFCMHVWRKEFGGLDEKKLRKIRINVCRHTVCYNFASQIIVSVGWRSYSAVSE